MDVENLLSELTLEEKASLCSGEDFWHTKAVERLGIPSVMVCDGPNGLRKQEDKADHLGMNESIKAVCFPTSSAIASGFDRDLARRAGQTLGQECQAENVAMLLGPGANIKRSPLCGRNFEYYSEDPYLSSQMASAFIGGIQSEGVGACLKHFAANNQETRRQSGDSVVAERPLHEIYLASFEGAVREAAPWGVMCSYNRVNGTFASENRTLLTDVLRTDWGYDGMQESTATVETAATPEPTSTPEITATPKPTEAPTATPEPTAEPTATPEPTVAPTPVVTAAPQPAATAEPQPAQQEPSSDNYDPTIDDLWVEDATAPDYDPNYDWGDTVLE